MSSGLDLSFEARLRSHLSVGEVFQLPSLFDDDDDDSDDAEQMEWDVRLLSECISAQREVIDRLHGSVLNALYDLAKSRSLAQLACCHRLQRTLDVQSTSMALAERLNEALRLEDEQFGLGTDFDDSARRRSIGKLQQVTRAMSDQRFVKLSKNSDVESTVQLEQQLYSYQCSVEAAIRSFAKISTTLVKHSATPGFDDEDPLIAAGDFEALFAALPAKYHRETDQTGSKRRS